LRLTILIIGITNAQLVSEEAKIAVEYKFQSIAEQNAVSVAWALLMQPRFRRIRECIYESSMERKRFRQVLVNAVIATDISDRAALQEQRRKWTLAFTFLDIEDDDGSRRTSGYKASGGKSTLRRRDAMNRKATVVIEHLIQVANVAHTMQHWTVYRRWNERLFEEMYTAYMNGRASFDPTAIWYRSELAFLEYYVIPLAKKMDECGVFGPSGDQYMSHAVANRNEWEKTGEDILKRMIEAVRVIEPDGSEVQGTATIPPGRSLAEQQRPQHRLHSQSESERSLNIGSNHTSEGYNTGASDVDSCAPLPELDDGLGPVRASALKKFTKTDVTSVPPDFASPSGGDPSRGAVGGGTTGKTFPHSSPRQNESPRPATRRRTSPEATPEVPSPSPRPPSSSPGAFIDKRRKPPKSLFEFETEEISL